MGWPKHFPLNSDYILGEILACAGPEHFPLNTSARGCLARLAALASLGVLRSLELCLEIIVELELKLYESMARVVFIKFEIE